MHLLEKAFVVLWTRGSELPRHPEGPCSIPTCPSVVRCLRLWQHVRLWFTAYNYGISISVYDEQYFFWLFNRRNYVLRKFSAFVLEENLRGIRRLETMSR